MSPVEHLLSGGHREEDSEREEHDPAAYAHLRDAITKMSHGALHRELNVPEGTTIPQEKLEHAAHSSNPLLARRARFAITMEHWRHGRKGPYHSEFHQE